MLIALKDLMHVRDMGVKDKAVCVDNSLKRNRLYVLIELSKWSINKC